MWQNNGLPFLQPQQLELWKYKVSKLAKQFGKKERILYLKKINRNRTAEELAREMNVLSEDVNTSD